jgi:hypothetical protein
MFFKRQFAILAGKKMYFAILSLWIYLCLSSLPFPKIEEIQPEGLSVFFYYPAKKYSPKA